MPQRGVGEIASLELVDPLLTAPYSGRARPAHMNDSVDRRHKGCKKHASTMAIIPVPANRATVRIVALVPLLLVVVLLSTALLKGEPARRQPR